MDATVLALGRVAGLSGTPEGVFEFKPFDGTWVKVFVDSVVDADFGLLWLADNDEHRTLGDAEGSCTLWPPRLTIKVNNKNLLSP